MDQINKMPKKQLREVICKTCGVIRMAFVDWEKCKKIGKLIVNPCPVCKNGEILIKQNKKRLK